MKTNLFFINKFIAIVFLVTHACTWNMWNDPCVSLLADNYMFLKNRETLNNKRDINEDKQNSILAAKHNRNNALLSLPKNPFNIIVANSIDTTKPLKEIIKPALLLSTTCKTFNAAFETGELLIIIGKACKSYTLEEKNAAMKMLLKKMNDVNYHNKRHAALLLTYAGAENNAYAPYPLLQDAVYKSDMQMITALFENGANPDQKNNYNEPVFFNAKKIDIAQKFITQSVNLNAQGYFNSNVLFACLTHSYSLEMIKFYLNNKVDATQKEPSGNNLLHSLATKSVIYYNIEDYLEIGILFIKTAPELVNALNKDGETPLDIALNMQQFFYEKKRSVLIKLFEEYGGKTAQQLKKDATKQVESTSQSTDTLKCCICLDNPKNIMNIPCKQNHTDKICIGCYESSLKFSDKCPLCRGALL